MTRTVSKQSCFCVAEVIFSLLIFCSVYFFRDEHTGLKTGGREPLQIQLYISSNFTVIDEKFCFHGKTLLLVRKILITSLSILANYVLKQARKLEYSDVFETQYPARPSYYSMFHQAQITVPDLFGFGQCHASACGA